MKNKNKKQNIKNKKEKRKFIKKIEKIYLKTKNHKQGIEKQERICESNKKTKKNRSPSTPAPLQKLKLLKH